MPNQSAARYPHHPYRDGYSVLPRLRKIEHAQIFETDPADHQRYLQEKQLAMNAQLCCVSHRFDDALRETVKQFLIRFYPISLSASATLEEIAAQMQEDVVVHALQDGQDWMAFGHVCFPSGWRPEKKIGQPLASIHAPIPGMDLAQSSKLVETMVQHGPFERFVWSVVFDDRLNFHPDQNGSRFDVNSGELFVKVERQVIVGFPEQGGALFLLRQSLVPSSSVDLFALANALRSMTVEQRQYKGLDSVGGEIIAWLDQQSQTEGETHSHQ